MRRSPKSVSCSLRGKAGRAAAVANGTDYTFTTEDCKRAHANGTAYTLTTEDQQNGRAAAAANGTAYTFTTEDRQRNRGVRKTRTTKFHAGHAKSNATRSGGGRFGDCRNWRQGCGRSAAYTEEGLCKGPCKDGNGDVLSVPRTHKPRSNQWGVFD
eukprot:COSAG01_NODE_367_length_18064_cov_23.990315_15_plen_156_part_00